MKRSYLKLLAAALMAWTLNGPAMADDGPEKSGVKSYQYDVETGFFKAGERYYDPVLGRFTQQDKYLGTIAEPLSLNLYSYVYNNPTKYTDPSGRYPMLMPRMVIQPPDIGKIGVYYQPITERGPNVHTQPMQERGSNVIADPIPERDDNDNVLTHPIAERQENVLIDLPTADPDPGYYAARPGLLTGTVTEGDSGIVRVERTYQTYVKINSVTGEVYTGRTSGTGTPEENVEIRDRRHHKNAQGFGPAKVDRSSSDPDAIRGREQQHIDELGGAQSDGGTSGNKIRGVSRTNQNAQRYENAAKKEFP